MWEILAGAEEEAKKMVARKCQRGDSPQRCDLRNRDESKMLHLAQIPKQRGELLA